MSLGRGPPPKSLDASGLLVLDGGGSTSIPAGWRPFKVSFMASKEHNMRASSRNGGGGIGGGGVAYDDAPLSWFPQVLTISYDLNCINQSCQGEFKDISHLLNLN